MKYYVYIGSVSKGFRDDVEESSGDFHAVPFGVDTLEEAHLLVNLSKTPAWYITSGETAIVNWDTSDIEVSPLVLRTRERDRVAKAQRQAQLDAKIQRINAQPETVEKVYAGITVVFNRKPLRPTTEYAYHHYEARVDVIAKTADGDWDFPYYQYITSNGRVQKAKWRTDWSVQRHKLEALADHLKDIEAVRVALSTGAYEERDA